MITLLLCCNNVFDVDERFNVFELFVSGNRPNNSATDTSRSNITLAVHFIEFLIRGQVEALQRNRLMYSFT